MSKWIQDRELDLVRQASSVGGPLIISAFIGGAAAVAWPRPPGRQKLDRQRFVEAWVKLSAPEAGADRISLPLLIAGLERSGNAKTATTLRATHGALSQGRDAVAVGGREVDLSSERVKEIAPDLDLARIRRYSYGSVFYAEVRSGLVHEYRFGRDAGTGLQVEAEAYPGYFHTRDLVGDPRDPRSYPIRRQIHFPIDWLIRLARGIADSVEPLIKIPPVSLPFPVKWWVDGG